MLNKKSIFNIVYAIALFGAFTSCVGILNELLNVVQLNDTYIKATYTFTQKEFFLPLSFYILAFIISALTFIIAISNLINIDSLKKFSISKYKNIIIIAACAVLFVMTVILVYLLRDKYIINLPVNYKYTLGYYEYLIIYTLRSGIMSFIANMFVIVLLNSIDKKSKMNSGKSSDLNIDTLQ